MLPEAFHHLPPKPGVRGEIGLFLLQTLRVLFPGLNVKENSKVLRSLVRSRQSPSRGSGLNRTWGREGPHSADSQNNLEGCSPQARLTETQGWRPGTHPPSHFPQVELPQPPTTRASAKSCWNRHGPARSSVPSLWPTHCWAAGQRLWAASGWGEARASSQAGRSLAQVGVSSLHTGLLNKAAAPAAHHLLGTHCGYTTDLTWGPTPGGK